MKVLVYGASTNPQRYAYLAAHLLHQKGHEIVLVGIKKGELLGATIHPNDWVEENIDTVTLYVGPQNQEGLLEYLKKIHPRRVIFNPGTENEILKRNLEEEGIETDESCTLVLLQTGQF
ncbi:CoA-binding protein [Aquirufa aurantiipilula]|uniref:CoA-binding protein n=1 Tax=Aquirufa aurantiipilula TaxID=2696561 RepID=UPI001CAA7151|nr:CoA-binding protein [Aquirufa aurantiipilula]MBZ1327415.1 CoA-binding protein [Aquirufa aurantiipilula]